MRTNTQKWACDSATIRRAERALQRFHVRDERTTLKEGDRDPYTIDLIIYHIQLANRLAVQ